MKSIFEIRSKLNELCCNVGEYDVILESRNDELVAALKKRDLAHIEALRWVLYDTYKKH